MTEYPEKPMMTAPLIDFTAWLENLRTDVSETVNGVVLRGARAVQVGASAGGTSRPATAAASLVGFALRNTSSTDVATVLLRDGRDSDGALIFPVTLAANESARDWFGPGGINLTEGLHVEVTAGAVDGAVFMRGVS